MNYKIIFWTENLIVREKIYQTEKNGEKKKRHPKFNIQSTIFFFVVSRDEGLKTDIPCDPNHPFLCEYFVL